MALSSINIQVAQGNSESHNERKCELDYVKSEHSHKNESWKEDSISNRREFIEQRCKAISGRKLQKNATPIREGVLLFEKHHDMSDMKKVADAIEERFGIKTFQIHMHRDEGHYDERKWKPNLHAHFVFDWSDDKTGKMLRLGKAEMSEMQSLVAETLGMERGVSSDRKHLSALQFKIEESKKQIRNAYTEERYLQSKAEDCIVTNLIGVVNKEETVKKIMKEIDMQSSLSARVDELKPLAETWEQMRNKAIEAGREASKSKDYIRTLQEHLFLSSFDKIESLREKHKKLKEEVRKQYDHRIKLEREKRQRKIEMDNILNGKVKKNRDKGMSR